VIAGIVEFLALGAKLLDARAVASDSSAVGIAASISAMTAGQEWAKAAAGDRTIAAESMMMRSMVVFLPLRPGWPAPESTTAAPV
jgi:hypothetical protein